MTELINVKGIGPLTVEKLMEKGVKDASELAGMNPDELKAILGLSWKKAHEIIQDALSSELDTMVELKTAQEIEDHKKKYVRYINTGSEDLDRIMGGGVATDAISAFCGEYATGKTQMGEQLLVNCVKMKRKAIFVETEPSTFDLNRVKEIAEAAGVEINPNNDIWVIPARIITDPQKQYLAYVRIEKFCSEGNDVGLIVIDSFSARFRSYYQRREMLPDRAREEARHLAYLQFLSSKYNLAVVVTVQVMGVPDTGAQLAVKMKVGSFKMPVGGDVMLHGATHWINLIQIKTKMWKAEIFDSPNLPRDETTFIIDKRGIRDVK